MVTNGTNCLSPITCRKWQILQGPWIWRTQFQGAEQSIALYGRNNMLTTLLLFKSVNFKVKIFQRRQLTTLSFVEFPSCLWRRKFKEKSFILHFWKFLFFSVETISLIWFKWIGNFKIQGNVVDQSLLQFELEWRMNFCRNFHEFIWRQMESLRNNEILPTPIDKYTLTISVLI